MPRYRMFKATLSTETFVPEGTPVEKVVAIFREEWLKWLDGPSDAWLRCTEITCEDVKKEA